MSTIRVIYARSHSFGGWLIRWWDNVAPNYWSHSGAIVENGENPYVVEAVAFKGVVVTTLEDFKSRYSAWEIAEYDVPDVELGDQWLANQLGKKYDYLAVFGRLFRQDWENQTRWHCQELVEGRLVASGLRRFRPGPQCITPNLGYAVVAGTR